ncbi:MAG: GNAT family N-acetyltransferase [Candidatus Lokiarchaeota archaeon]|nr:GNAT family N-acetyltransferase [Candidatus Lokiarchaeota archaeon]
MTKETPNVFLQGDMIDLLPLNSEHASLYVKWENSPEVRVYARNSIPITMEEMKKDLETQKEGLKKEIVFEVFHKEDKKPIGYCVINDINYLDCNAYFGLVIGEKEYWGQNIATETARLLVKYAFNELNLNKLYAKICTLNTGSWRAAEKNRFIREGLFKKDAYIGGKFLDTYVYSLLREDWSNNVENE